MESSTWEDILVQIGGCDPSHFTGRHGPCPNCGGTDRFRWEGGENGRWYCSQCGGRNMKGGGGYGLAMLSRLRQCSWQEALALVRNSGDGKVPTRSAVVASSSSRPYRKPDKPPADIHAPRTTSSTTGMWCYRDASGDPLFWIQRLEFAGEKKVYVERTWSGVEWDWLFPSKRSAFRHHWPLPKPPYNLHRIAKAKCVLITEGEKACDAANQVLSFGLTPDTVAISWAGGTNRWHQTDWAGLSGKKMILWPDYDAAGIQCMKELKEHLVAEGIATAGIGILDPGAHPSSGWDAADEVAAFGVPTAAANLQDALQNRARNNRSASSMVRC